MKEVACITGIKAGTVAFHKYKIMDTLGIKTNAALVEYALKHNLATKLFN
jgi:DNA-binding CsgD family transcriptional regulator